MTEVPAPCLSEPDITFSVTIPQNGLILVSGQKVCRMNNPLLSPRLIEPVLLPALRPALPHLGISLLAEGVSGLAKLGALWCLIGLIGTPSAAWVLGACVCWAVSGLCSSASSWLAHHAEARFSAYLRRQVARHLTQLPPRTLARYGEQSLRRLVSEDIAALHHLVAHLPAEIVTFFIVPATSMVLMLTLAGPISLIALLPGAIAALYYLFLVPRYSARFGSERMTVMGSIITAVNDYVRGLRVNRLYGAQSGALADYHRATQRFAQGMEAWVGHVATFAAIATALLQAVVTFAVAYAVSYELTPTAIAATLFFGLAIVTPSLRLGHGLDYVANGRSAGKHIASLLNEAVTPHGSTAMEVSSVVLTADNICLTTEHGSLIEPLTHQFTPGTVTTITGPSGTGKTTLLRMLAGVEPPDAGIVRLHQVAIAELCEPDRHRAIQLIPQHNPVLSATVRDNLLLSAPNASDAQLQSALSQAQIQVSLDSEASLLSGGEQQRVGLARLFLSSAAVILLDEPTSALDRQTADQLMTALLHFAESEHKTLVMVTHDSALAARGHQQITLQHKELNQ